MDVMQKDVALIQETLSQLIAHKTPDTLYAPMGYLLQLGGKRIRPLLTLLAYQTCGKEDNLAVKPALGIELFHNFTLMHDDIMDHASLRRGQATVHEKWNTNTAILSGDALMIESYNQFEQLPGHLYKDVLTFFNAIAIEVCQGQQMDMDFVERSFVSEDEYLEMIRLKTSVLIGCCTKLGAMIAEQEKDIQNLFYDFGENLGMAFQLMDDYLDTFGTKEQIGKEIGGDILENKKTILYIYAMQHAKESDKMELQKLYTSTDSDPLQKITIITEIFKESGASKYLLEKSLEYHEAAIQSLDALPMSRAIKSPLYSVAEKLIKRDH